MGVTRNIEDLHETINTGEGGGETGESLKETFDPKSSVFVNKAGEKIPAGYQNITGKRASEYTEKELNDMYKSGSDTFKQRSTDESNYFNELVSLSGFNANRDQENAGISRTAANLMKANLEKTGFGSSLSVKQRSDAANLGAFGDKFTRGSSSSFDESTGESVDTPNMTASWSGDWYKSDDWRSDLTQNRKLAKSLFKRWGAGGSHFVPKSERQEGFDNVPENIANFMRIARDSNKPGQIKSDSDLREAMKDYYGHR